jgi:hypothetical protein
MLNKKNRLRKSKRISNEEATKGFYLIRIVMVAIV